MGPFQPAQPDHHQHQPLHLHQPIGHTLDLPHYVTDTWSQRLHRIYPSEAAALPIATWALAPLLQGADILWLMDNEAAVSAGIRGSSGLPEVDIMVQAAHLLWMRHDMRVWIEWIDTNSNPADGLSRDGLDVWTQQQKWQLSTVPNPPWSDDVSTPQSLYQQLLQTLGGG